MYVYNSTETTYCFQPPSFFPKAAMSIYSEVRDLGHTTACTHFSIVYLLLLKSRTGPVTACKEIEIIHRLAEANKDLTHF